ncbi:MAG: hypothetical protein KDE09_12445 [Anaerolineales bacterium]|nr:hypothetical protein [Anaerolineales bacterium]MCB0029001.1 hypothetical protein [Anaerolineales bacterium]MCB8961959.1 hypothetical protein [Ardenticatenales bacterium]
MKLTDYDVDEGRGFLPAVDPLAALPPAFAELDALGAELPALLLTGRCRRTLKRFPDLPLDQLTSPAELERALLLISALGMAYIWGEPEPVRMVPAALAVPWARVAERLGRPPIITHASIVLNNWRRLDPNGPLDADNLACRQHFLGGMDEQWFFTATAALEATGAPALRPLVDAMAAAAAGDDGTATRLLTQVAAIFGKVNNALARIYERCDPYIFYHRIRPFLTGWDKEGILFEGVSRTPLRLHGGSAAQSSLIQAYDAALGIEHLHPETQPFLRLMRDYMPPAHRRFIAALGEGPSLHDFAQRRDASVPLKRIFNECIDQLEKFRQAHMEIAVRYILHQSPQGEAGAVGTGGTSFVPFLSEARKETKARRLR